MAPTLLTPTSIALPKVVRKPADAPSPDGGGDDTTTATTLLPLGVRLTGGAKLRQDGKTGKGIKVAVIDSGIDAEHPGFNGQVKHQMWFRGGSPLEEDDHGTHVAGTIHYLAPDAELYDYRVFGTQGAFSVEQAICAAIVEAVYDGCHVINMSLGGRWSSVSIRTAVQFATERDVIVVCAAGNTGDDNILTNERQ